MPVFIKSPDDVAHYVAQRLKLARQMKQISSQHIANKLGISRKQIQNYETAQCNLTVPRLWEIANLLEVDTSFFTDGLKGEYASVSNQDLEFLTSFAKIKDPTIKNIILNILNSVN